MLTVRRPSMRHALAALALAASGTSCILPATLVEVLVETDLPGDGPYELRVYAREGERPFGTMTPARASATFAMVVRRTRSGDAPSFVLVPREGGPRDGTMTARIEAESDGVVLRRDVRFRFVPNQHGYLRIVLRASCALPDTRCRSIEPCTRQAVCEENGQTCGDNGVCVTSLVVPTTMRGTPVGPQPFDATPGMDVTEPFDAGVDVQPPIEACVPNCTGRRCGEPDGCGGLCESGPCAGGEACVMGRCECAPGFTSCGGMCRPSADVECSVGATRSMSCGACGMRMDRCGADCRWQNGMCSGGGSCMPGETQREPCGRCGSRTRTCGMDCNWGAWSGCAGEGVCAAGTTEMQGCGNCGTQTRMCQSDCRWGTWSACSGSGPCTPGQTQSQGCGNCGTQSRTCQPNCQWGAYGACSGSGPCTPGQTQSQGCGNCGTQSRTCSSTCQWPAWGACTGEGACAPGATRSGCDSCGVEVCSASCSWGACQPRAGAQCLHRGGTNYRSCSMCRNGAQFCLPSCSWSTACCSLGSCPSCLPP